MNALTPISVLTIYIRELNLSKFVVLKHFGREFLQPEPCSRLDISIQMLRCVLRVDIFSFTMSLNDVLLLPDTGMPAVSPISCSPTFDVDKKNRNGANLSLFYTAKFSLTNLMTVSSVF